MCVLYKDVIDIVHEILSIPYYTVLEATENKEVLILSNERGHLSLWLLDVNELTKNRLTAKPILLVARPAYFTDRVIFTRDVSGGGELQLIFQTDMSGNEEVFADMKPMRILSIASDGDRAVFTASDENSLSLFVATEREIKKVREMPGLCFVTDVRGERAVGYGNLYNDPSSMEIFIVDLSEGDMKIVTPLRGSSNKNPVLYSNDELAFETNAYGGVNSLVTYDLRSEEFSPLKFEGRDYQENPPVDHQLYKHINGKWLVVGKSEGLSRLFVNGYLLPTPRGMISGATILNDEVILSHSSFDSPPSIIGVRPNKVHRKILETPLSDRVKRALAEIRFTYVESFDKTRVPVFILESGVATKPGPTVVYLHGGPWSEVTNSWSPIIATLIASGFHVVAPNYRGSSGYGEDFKRLILGDPGGKELLDIIEVSEHVIKEGLPSSLFVLGYSYGGYLSIWALENTELFNCGVSIAGIADWRKLYEGGDKANRMYVEMLFGKDLSILEERSPINKVDNLRAPICIIHSRNDPRTPLKPMLDFIYALATRHKTFEAHIYPYAGHLPSSSGELFEVILPSVLFLRKCHGGHTTVLTSPPP